MFIPAACVRINVQGHSHSPAVTRDGLLTALTEFMFSGFDLWRDTMVRTLLFNSISNLHVSQKKVFQHFDF